MTTDFDVLAHQVADLIFEAEGVLRSSTIADTEVVISQEKTDFDTDPHLGVALIFEAGAAPSSTIVVELVTEGTADFDVDPYQPPVLRDLVFDAGGSLGSTLIAELDEWRRLATGHQDETFLDGSAQPGTPYVFMTEDEQGVILISEPVMLPDTDLVDLIFHAAAAPGSELKVDTVSTRADLIFEAGMAVGAGFVLDAIAPVYADLSFEAGGRIQSHMIADLVVLSLLPLRLPVTVATLLGGYTLGAEGPDYTITEED